MKTGEHEAAGYTGAREMREQAPRPRYASWAEEVARSRDPFRTLREDPFEDPREDDGQAWDASLPERDPGAIRYMNGERYREVIG